MAVEEKPVGEMAAETEQEEKQEDPKEEATETDEEEKKEDKKPQGNGDKTNAWIAAASYDLGMAKVMAVYSQDQDSSGGVDAAKVKGYLVGLTAPLGAGTAKAAFSNSKQGSTVVTNTPMVRDTIASVGTDSTGAKNLALKGGASIKYDSIKSIL